MTKTIHCQCQRSCARVGIPLSSSSLSLSLLLSSSSLSSRSLPSSSLPSSSPSTSSGRDGIAFGNIMKIAEFHRDIFTQVGFVFYIFQVGFGIHIYTFIIYSKLFARGYAMFFMIQKSWKTFWSRENEKSRFNEILNQKYRKFSLELRLIPLIYNESHSQERYERYCVNKPKSECVVKVVIYFLFKFFLSSMACTYKEQLSYLTHC